jgi:Transcription factor WhiB
MNQEWRKQAACLGADEKPFFSDSGNTQHWVIRTFCDRCLVRVECRDLADRTDPTRPYGVFGGTTGKRRLDERRQAQRLQATA